MTYTTLANLKIEIGEETTDNDTFLGILQADGYNHINAELEQLTSIPLTTNDRAYYIARAAERCFVKGYFYLQHGTAYDVDVEAARALIEEFYNLIDRLKSIYSTPENTEAGSPGLHQTHQSYNVDMQRASQYDNPLT